MTATQGSRGTVRWGEMSGWAGVGARVLVVGGWQQWWSFGWLTTKRELLASLSDSLSRSQGSTIEKVASEGRRRLLELGGGHQNI